MDAKHTDRFRSLLEKQREDVLIELGRHRPTSPPADDREGRDRESQASRAAAELAERTIAEDHENLLRKIDYALERLEAGTYRECANCGATIPLARLEAKPSASLCLACQEEKDAGRLTFD